MQSHMQSTVSWTVYIFARYISVDQEICEVDGIPDPGCSTTAVIASVKGPDKQIQIDESGNILDGVYLSKYLLSALKILYLGGD